MPLILTENRVLECPSFKGTSSEGNPNLNQEAGIENDQADLSVLSVSQMQARLRYSSLRNFLLYQLHPVEAGGSHTDALFHPKQNGLLNLWQNTFLHPLHLFRGKS